MKLKDAWQRKSCWSGAFGHNLSWFLPLCNISRWEREEVNTHTHIIRSFRASWFASATSSVWLKFWPRLGSLDVQDPPPKDPEYDRSSCWGWLKVVTPGFGATPSMLCNGGKKTKTSNDNNNNSSSSNGGVNPVILSVVCVSVQNWLSFMIDHLGDIHDHSLKVCFCLYEIVRRRETDLCYGRRYFNKRLIFQGKSSSSWKLCQT